MTREQVQASIYDVLAQLGVGTTSWKPGAVVRTMIVGTSIVLAAFSALQAEIAKSGFLELAEGQWLTLVARHVYGVERITATFATGQLTLYNSGGGVYVMAPGDLVALNPVTGKTYRNASAFTLSALSDVTIDIIAVEAGSTSSALPSTITELTTTLLGVSCDNTLGLVGLDDERDPALRSRCSEKLGALSPFGPWDAYASAARNAKRADGSSLGVTRFRITKDGYGNVTTYLATASGEVPGADVVDADEAIQQWAAPLAVTAHTESALGHAVPVTYEVWLYNTSGLSPSAVQDAIALRLQSFFSTQPIGGNVIGSDPGKVFHDAIRRTIGASVAEIFHVVVTAPAADVTLAVDEVPTLGVVTCTAVNQEPPPEGYEG
jgi:hypothetical protein